MLPSGALRQITARQISSHRPHTFRQTLISVYGERIPNSRFCSFEGSWSLMRIRTIYPASFPASKAFHLAAVPFLYDSKCLEAANLQKISALNHLVPLLFFCSLLSHFSRSDEGLHQERRGFQDCQASRGLVESGTSRLQSPRLRGILLNFSSSMGLYTSGWPWETFTSG